MMVSGVVGSRSAHSNADSISCALAFHLSRTEPERLIAEHQLWQGTCFENNDRSRRNRMHGRVRAT